MCKDLTYNLDIEILGKDSNLYKKIGQEIRQDVSQLF